MTPRPKKDTPKKDNNTKGFLNLKFTQHSLAIVASVIVIVGGILGILSVLLALYTDISFIGKISAIALFYGLIFFIWWSVKIDIVKKLLIFVVIAFSAFILVWAIYSINSYLNEVKIRGKESLKNQRKTPIFQLSEPRYKILILPFQLNKNEQFESAGSTIYQHLKDLNAKEKLNLSIAYANQLAGLDIHDSAAYFRTFHQADLIVYGQFYPAEGNNPAQIRLNYIAEGNWLLGKMSKQTNAELSPISLSGLSAGAQQGDIDFIIQFIVGYKEYAQGKSYAAINRLIKIENCNYSDKIDFILGTSYAKVGNYSAAILFLQRAIAKNPNFNTAHINLGITYMVLGNFKNALTEADFAINHNTKDHSAYQIKGYIKYTLSDFRGAIVDVNKSIALNPKDAWGYYTRGLSKYYLKDYQGAIADLTKTIKLDPTAFDAYSDRGNAKYDSKDFQGAITDCSKAIDIDPKNADAYNTRGNARLDLNDYQGSITDYSKTLELNPKNPEAFVNRGIARTALEKFNDAITDYLKAIEIDSNNEDNTTLLLAYDNLGFCYLSKKDYPNAQENFNKCVKLNAGYIDAILGLALVNYIILPFVRTEKLKNIVV